MTVGSLGKCFRDILVKKTEITRYYNRKNLVLGIDGLKKQKGSTAGAQR